MRAQEGAVSAVETGPVCGMAVQRADARRARRNRLRQEEITEEIEVLMLSADRLRPPQVEPAEARNDG